VEETITSTAQADPLIQKRFLSKQAEPPLRATIEFHPSLDVLTRINLVYEDQGLVLSYPTEDAHKADFLRPDIAEVPCEDDRNPSCQHPVFFISQKPEKGQELLNAAIGYRDLNEGKSTVGLTLRFAKKFPTEDLLRSYLAKRADLKATRTWHNKFGEDYWAAEFAIPQGLKDQVKTHWITTFSKSEIILYLDNPAQLMISAAARPTTSKDDGSSISITFASVSPPTIKVGIEEF